MGSATQGNAVTVSHCSGERNKRKAIISGLADFVIINFDGVKIVEDEIINGGFDLIIIDEANAYKNSRTERFKVMRKIVSHDKWLWMMTGTPAAQSPLDAAVTNTISSLVVSGSIATVNWSTLPAAKVEVKAATAPYTSVKVRNPIVDKASYLEHSVRASLGNETSKMYVAAAADVTDNAGLVPTRQLTEVIIT